MPRKSQTERSTRRAPADLRVYLLGPPRVAWAGDPLKIPRRQVRALLYHLAARLEPIPREQLCFLFWPDVPESKARRSLSVLLSHLRRVLPTPDALLTSGDRVGLNPRRGWSDSLAFERLCDPSREESRPPDALQQAIDLYRGPFLAGFSLPGSPEFETWASLERQVWERQYLEALSALMEVHDARGELDAAIVCARRYLATDELAEEIHRRLIQLYAAAGDRMDAVQQYERCAIVLERELSVSPLPETQAVYQAIRKGRPQPSPRAAPSPAWTTLPSLDAPLVGRDGAQRRLKRAWRFAQSGYGRAILIAGEAGIGKSRLMQDFVTPLEGEATLLTGSGHETEQGVPYWPLVEALRPHLRPIDWAALDVDPIYVAEAARLLPELRGLLPDLPEPYPVEPTQRQGRLFQALTRCLLGIATRASDAHQPLILCLDDLHWADKTTLSYLGYLTRHSESAPILVLGAYRTGEAAAVAALRAELLRLDIFREIRLQGLGQAEVLHLVRHLSGQSSGAERFSRRLHREAGGNPFFLLEILRAMFEAGLLRQDETGWSTDVDEITADYRELPLPGTVTEAIRDRLRRLNSQTRQVLEAGAVLGYRFDHDLVWQTSGRGEGEVVDALDVLLTRQVIAESDGEYRFIHDLTRGVVYGDLSYGRRRLLHRRAGEALERLRPDRTVALARHFERAEQMDRAVGYLLEVGEKAMRMAAPEEAVAHLTRALSLFKTLPDASERVQQELQLQLALGVSLQITRGHGTPRAGRAHARASELCRQLGDTRQLFATLGLLLMFHTTAGDQRTAGDIGADLLDVARQAGDPSLVMIGHWQLGIHRLVIGELAEARSHLEQAVAGYDAEQHHPLTFRFGLEPGVMSLAALSWVLWMLGYPEQALAPSREAMALAEALAYPPGVAVAQLYTSAFHIFRRDWQAVQESAEAVLRISTRHGLVYWRTAGLVCRGRAVAQRGALEEGIAQIDQGLADGRDMGAEAFTVLQYVLLAESYRKAGRWGQGLAAVDEALRIAQHTGERFYQPEAHRLKGELLRMLTEDETEVEACFRRAIELARRQAAKMLELRAAMSLCRLWREQGKREKARQTLAEVYGWFTEGFDTRDLKEARALLEALS